MQSFVNFPNLVLIIMQVLGFASPFIALYAISLAKKKQFNNHRKVHKLLFWSMTLLVVIFELSILFSEQGGFLPDNNPLLETSFFKVLLIAHIIGSVLTFLTWGSLFFISSVKYKKSFTNSFAKTHKTIGYLTVFGLFYVAITSVAISTIAFIL